MAESSNIRAGRAYIEIGANDKTLKAGLDRALARVKAYAGAVAQVGKSMQAAGTNLVKYGGAASAPLLIGAKAFASYEQALADLRAAANPTAAELEKIKAAIDSVSDSTGKDRVDVTAAFSELLKAGMPLEKVLGGAAEAAIKFARVGGLEVADAVSAMNDALNVFAREGMDASQVSPAKMEELAADVENLGPTFIKLAQLLSTRADLLPQPYIDALTRLQDKVGPFPFTEVEQIVSSELGVRISKAFSEFQQWRTYLDFLDRTIGSRSQ